MKKIKRFLIVIAVCVCCLFGSGCFSEERTERGCLDMTGIPVLEVGQDENLEVNRTFNESTSTSTKTFTFTRTSDVQSFRYRAYYNGTYKFKVEPACAFEIYVHSGSIVTDWWEEVPCDEDLSAGYEYTIEVRVTSTDILNTPINLQITTPNTSTKDITGCRSFVDDYNGDLEYYTFVAPYSGKYTFTINNVYMMDILNANGKVIDYTGWDSWSKTLSAGYKLTIKIKSMESKNIKKIYGYVRYPVETTVDITDILEEKSCVAIKYNPMWTDQEVKLKIRSSTEEEYVLSTCDVGVQAITTKEPLREENTYASRKEGFDFLSYSCEGLRDEGIEEFITVDAGETKEITIQGLSKLNNKEYWLTIFKKGVDKQYLPYQK